jgi:uncharacterized protein YneR
MNLITAIGATAATTTSTTGGASTAVQVQFSLGVRVVQPSETQQKRKGKGITHHNRSASHQYFVHVCHA